MHSSRRCLNFMQLFLIQFLIEWSLFQFKIEKKKKWKIQNCKNEKKKHTKTSSWNLNFLSIYREKNEIIYGSFQYPTVISIINLPCERMVVHGRKYLLMFACFRYNNETWLVYVWEVYRRRKKNSFSFISIAGFKIKKFSNTLVHLGILWESGFFQPFHRFCSLNFCDKKNKLNYWCMVMKGLSQGEKGTVAIFRWHVSRAVINKCSLIQRFLILSGWSSCARNSSTQIRRHECPFTVYLE